MGRVRAHEQPEESSIDEEVALLIAGILLGTVSVPNPTLAIAEALVNLVPSFLPAPLRADISAHAARLVLTDQQTPTEGSGALVAVGSENLKYRVAYGFAAIKRLVKAVSKPSEERVEERLAKALKAEASYLEAHRNAAERRSQMAQMIEQAVATYGPVLSWRAVKRETSRPHHLAADARNWNASNGPPRATGALPGVLPNCLCSFGPPIPGAKEIS
jgi:hypothetical protein